MSSFANEISGKAFDTQEITPEFNQHADPTINQENSGQEGVADGNQQSEKSEDGIQGITDAFNSVVSPEPTLNIYQQDLERYAHLNEESFENNPEQSQQLDSNELSTQQAELQEGSLQEPERKNDMEGGLSL